MSEWYDSQKNPSSNLRQLQQERIEKPKPRRELTTDEVKRLATLEAIQQQMVEAKKNERANALKEVKRLCKEFGFTAGMLKGALTEGRKKL